MQLGAAEAAEDMETEEGEKPKVKGKGKGRGGKGRGRGRGQRAADPDKHHPAGDAASSRPETSEEKPKRVGKSKAKAAQPDRASADGEERVGEPVPKVKAKAKARVKKSQAATSEVAGGEDGGGCDAAAPAPVPKRRRLRSASAAVEPAAAPVMPQENPAEGHVAAPEGNDLPLREPVEDGAGPGHGPANSELSANALTNLQTWKRKPQRWETLRNLHIAMFAEPKPTDMNKLKYYTLSMYWKTFRVGLVHKPSKKHVLSFNACGTRRIGLPLAAADEYVHSSAL